MDHSCHDVEVKEGSSNILEDRETVLNPMSQNYYRNKVSYGVSKGI